MPSVNSRLLVMGAKVWGFQQTSSLFRTMKPSSHARLSFSEDLSFLLLDYVGVDYVKPHSASGNRIQVLGVLVEEGDYPLLTTVELLTIFLFYKKVSGADA